MRYRVYILWGVLLNISIRQSIFDGMVWEGVDFQVFCYHVWLSVVGVEENVEVWLLTYTPPSLAQNI